MDVLAGGQVMSFDSGKSDDELDDFGKMLKMQMGPMLTAVIFAKGNGLGEVLEMKVEPNIPGVEDVGNQASSVAYPKEAVKIGTTWNMEKENKGSKMNFVYTVKSISGKEVVLSISGSISGKANGTISGDMNVDRKSGIPLKSTINMKMNVNGQEMETNMVSAMKKI